MIMLNAVVQQHPCLQELQQAVSVLKQGLVGVQGALDKSHWHEYLQAVLREPLQRYGHVQQFSDSFMEVPTMGLPDRLIRQGSKCLSKGKEAQVTHLQQRHGMHEGSLQPFTFVVS